MKTFYFHSVEIKKNLYKILFTKFYLVSTKYYHILLCFTSSGVKSDQTPPKEGMCRGDQWCWRILLCVLPILTSSLLLELLRVYVPISHGSKGRPAHCRIIAWGIAIAQGLGSVVRGRGRASAPRACPCR